jgi:hypothetical protein
MNKTPEELALEAYLAGITDKKAQVNDNKLLAIPTILSNRKKNGWDEKNVQRYEDPEYAKRVGKSISATYSTDEMREVQAMKAAGANSKEHNENIRKARLDAPPRSAETRAKLSVNNVGNNRRCKPVITPHGVYISLKEAGLALIEQGVFNYRPSKAAHTIREYIRAGEDGYKHISREEYMMLTGKEL